MTYLEFIKSIPKDRILEYYEVHHIIPKCLGGANDESNLIKLTPREHFIAHKLLAEENPHEKRLTFAFHLMSTDGRHETTAEEYEIAKKMHSDSMKGTALHTTPHSAKTRKLISENTKSVLANPEVYQRLVESHKNPSEEIRKRMSEAQLGRVHSEDTKRKMSASHLGKKYATMSEEGRRNLSESHKGKVYTYNLKCRVCGMKFLGNNPGIRRCSVCKGSGEL